MKKGKIIGLIALAGIIIGGGIFSYMWFMPHRDVQASPIDIEITSDKLVQEYLDDAEKANEKYLQDEGDSKILAVTGTVSGIEEDMNQQKVVYLKSGTDAKVSCTFTKETNLNAEQLKEGDDVKIKGVIRAGASYDEDLEMYEDVIMEKCDVLK